MNSLSILATQPGVARLGSTLLHFLWQGVAIAAVYAAARKWAATAAPNVRYLLGCAALSAMAAAPLVTWLALGPSPAAHVATTSLASPLSVTAAASGTVRDVPYARPGAISAATAAPFLSWVVAAWLAGATALWVRLFGGWILAVELRSRLVLPAPAAWQQTLDRLKARIGVARPVRLLLSSLVQAPVVVGWLRPVVLTPIGALTGLPAEQMEALLLHELAHIRRYDYLVNMLQSAVEALLFYHPAVWWVSGHMRAERELCCDDAAVSVTGDVVAYARALAQIGSLHPPVVMAANGGSLAHRIGRLLGQPRSAPRTLSGTGIVAAAVLPILAALAVFAQPAQRPKFEVASIKRAADQGPRMMRPLPNGLTGTVSFSQLIQRAYAVQPFQIAGGPEWIHSERYTIDAKATGNVSHDKVSLMLQSLLEERFQLKIHRETRELPIFHLVIAKGGPNLPSPKEGGCTNSDDPPPELTGGRMTPPGSGPTPMTRCGGLDVMLQMKGARMSGGKVPMPEFVRMLSMVLDRTVVDRTGLTGPFDIRLDFLPDDSTPHLPPPPPDAPPSSVMSPPILSALPEQLGLRLEAVKGPVDVIVIDRVERPSAN
jgi:uncharacterized protein (TIGR03435 family)